MDESGQTEFLGGMNEMKKLKLPKLQPFDIDEALAKKDFDKYFDENYNKLIPSYDFDVCGLFVVANIDGDLDYISDEYSFYMYAFVSNTSFDDNAIAKTCNFYFDTFAQWKKAVKDMDKALIQVYKNWVKSLYEEDKND